MSDGSACSHDVIAIGDLSRSVGLQTLQFSILPLVDLIGSIGNIVAGSLFQCQFQIFGDAANRYYLISAVLSTSFVLLLYSKQKSLLVLTVLNAKVQAIGFISVTCDCHLDVPIHKVLSYNQCRYIIMHSSIFTLHNICSIHYACATIAVKLDVPNMWQTYVRTTKVSSLASKQNHTRNNNCFLRSYLTLDLY